MSTRLNSYFQKVDSVCDKQNTKILIMELLSSKLVVIIIHFSLYTSLIGFYEIDLLALVDIFLQYYHSDLAYTCSIIICSWYLYR